jgi:hypothetical protein
MDTDPIPESAPETSSETDRLRFGPSPFMMLGGLVVHPFAWAGAAWGAFALSPSLRATLWSFNFLPWRKLLMTCWGYTHAHPWMWVLLPLVAAVHLVIRYSTSQYAYSDYYLFIQTGLFSIGSPGGPLRVFNDPIPFSTILDANLEKGLIGLITGTGGLFVKTSEQRGYVKLTWVPHVAQVQNLILVKAGVKKARTLTSSSA